VSGPWHRQVRTATHERPVVPIGRSGYDNFADSFGRVTYWPAPTGLSPTDVNYHDCGERLPSTPTQPLQPTFEANALEAELHHM